MEKLVRASARWNNQTATTDVTYPVGTLLLVTAPGSPPNKNATTGTVYHNASSTAWEMASGTPLTGTWRSCGLVSTAILMQRVA